MERVGDKVRKFREARGWTIKELAERADLTPNGVSRIELHYRSPGADTVVKLADALGVEPGDLFPKGGPLQESGLPQEVKDAGGIESSEALDPPQIIMRVQSIVDRFENREINISEFREELINTLRHLKTG